jgi:hypothetical protein
VDEGNVTFGPVAALIIKIGGPTACAEYDRFTVEQHLGIQDSTLPIPY